MFTRTTTRGEGGTPIPPITGGLLGLIGLVETGLTRYGEAYRGGIRTIPSGCSR
jgi:hypothetical protein